MAQFARIMKYAVLGVQADVWYMLCATSSIRAVLQCGKYAVCKTHCIQCASCLLNMYQSAFCILPTSRQDAAFGFLSLLSLRMIENASQWGQLLMKAQFIWDVHTTLDASVFHPQHLYDRCGISPTGCYCSCQVVVLLPHFASSVSLCHSKDHGAASISHGLALIFMWYWLYRCLSLGTFTDVWRKRLRGCLFFIQEYFWIMYCIFCILRQLACWSNHGIQHAC